MGFSRAMLLFCLAFLFWGYTGFLLQLSVVTLDNDSWDLNMPKRQRPLINAAIQLPIIVHRSRPASPSPTLHYRRASRVYVRARVCTGVRAHRQTGPIGSIKSCPTVVESLLGSLSHPPATCLKGAACQYSRNRTHVRQRRLLTFKPGGMTTH